MSDKTRIDEYDPRDLVVGKRRYTDTDIDRIVDAGGELPSGKVTIRDPYDLATEPAERPVHRREAIAKRVESAAQTYIVEIHHSNEAEPV